MAPPPPRKCENWSSLSYPCLCLRNDHPLMASKWYWCSTLWNRCLSKPVSAFGATLEPSSMVPFLDHFAGSFFVVNSRFPPSSASLTSWARRVMTCRPRAYYFCLPLALDLVACWSDMCHSQLSSLFVDELRWTLEVVAVCLLPATVMPRPAPAWGRSTSQWKSC